MKATFVRTALCPLALALCGACADDAPDAPPPEPAPQKSELQRRLDAVVESGFIGAQVEISVGGTARWAGAGVADLASGAPVGEKSRFRMGSATKTFVAVVALELVHEGVLSLDDTVERWLPGAVQGNGNDGGRITLRHLLQHTSGLYDCVEDQMASFAAAASEGELRGLLLRSWTAPELVALATARPPNFAPGERWDYTNTGYVLAGMIVEKATGKPWDQQVTERIVTKLSLFDTSAPGANPFLPSPHTRGYVEVAFQSAPLDATEVNPTALDAEGALVGATADLNVFFGALMRGELLAPPELAEMKKTTPLDDSGIGYGLGLAWFPLSCGGGYWGHPGDTLGFHTRNGVSDDGARAVTVSLTGGDDDVGPAVTELIDDALCGRL